MRKKIDGFKTFESKDSEYIVARIIDLLKNNDLSFHKKILNLAIISGVNTSELKLPPLVIPCMITLNNGDKHVAYLESNLPPYRYRYDNDSDNYLWVEYGDVNSKLFRRSSRKSWTLSEVKEWEFKK